MADKTTTTTTQKPNFGLAAAALANLQWAKHYPCNCWEIQLGQGVMVLPCATHQPAVLKAIQAATTT